MTDFQAEGLLEGLEGETREARRRLLEELEADGVPLEELRRAVEEQRLALVPVERALAGEPRYSSRELAERAGLPLEYLEAVRRAVGQAIPDPDDVMQSDLDVEAAELIATFRNAGLPEEQILDVSRVMGRGMAQTAEAIRELLAETFITAGGVTEHELAARIAQTVRELLPLMSPMMGQTLRIHLLDQVRAQAVSLAELESGQRVGTREIAVCFADLVGYTRLGERLAPDEVGEVATDLEKMTVATIASPVRLIKTIGDAVMLVAPEPAPVLDAALELVEEAEGRGERFPQLRAGVACGLAMPRGGDWYGRPVNLASRVTGVARPGSVLVESDVRNALEEGYRWSDAGERKLKGIKRPIHLFRARRVEPEPADG